MSNTQVFRKLLGNPLSSLPLASGQEGRDPTTTPERPDWRVRKYPTFGQSRPQCRRFFGQMWLWPNVECSGRNQKPEPKSTSTGSIVRMRSSSITVSEHA